MNKIIAIILLLCVSATIVESIDINYKIDGKNFMKKQDGNWIKFNKFASVNIGVTIPGYLPGQVVMGRNEYIRIFEHMKNLHVNVVRVYALLKPAFYQQLIEWNNNNEHTIYVLHGTAFPEHEMEENNGTDAFEHKITERMTTFIERTVNGVYGGGEVIYRYNRGVDPVIGMYNTSIHEYLLGWVVSGEINPHAVYKTNIKHKGISYNGNFVASVPESSPFEVWVAKMLDHMMDLSVTKFNKAAPLTHTNWVTLDGIRNYVEARYPASEEDWMEFDLHHMNVKLESGWFYNEHIYPYYPDFLTVSETENSDPFFDYVKRITDFYNDKPFIVTEIGLPTSLAVSSYEDKFGRYHGHLGEIEQGEKMYVLLTKLMQMDNVYGVCVFQLLDEWFKKSWNIEDMDYNDRQFWHNTLTSEQAFGIIATEPQREHNNEIYDIDDSYIKSVSIANDEANVIIKINTKKDTGKVVIGFNTLPSGSNTPKNIGIRKTFSNDIDFILIVENNTVTHRVAGTHDMFYRRYAWWLSEDDNLVLDESVNDHINPEKGIFAPFKMLVKSPFARNISNQQVHTPHRSFTVDFEFEHDIPDKKNLALVSKNGDYTIIKIPYNLLGYSNPATHEKYIMSNIGREFKMNYITDSSPIQMEISYFIGEFEVSSPVFKSFSFDKWEVPKCFCERPKESYNYFRRAFSMIKYGNNGTDIEVDTWCSCGDPEPSVFTIHRIIVIFSYLFLLTLFAYASIGKVIVSRCLYCYNARKNDDDDNKPKAHLRAISFLLFLIMAYLVIDKIGISEISIFGMNIPLGRDIEVSQPKLSLAYGLYILVIIWDPLVLLVLVMFFGSAWVITKAESDDEFNSNLHAVIISCHNSSDVIQGTLMSLLEKMEPKTIYVSDNGSTEDEQNKTKEICANVSLAYQQQHNGNGGGVNYGHIYINVNGKKIGNKTIAQYASVKALPEQVKFVTCIDDDTRLDKSWSVNKVLKYFYKKNKKGKLIKQRNGNYQHDEEVAVLAYPLKAHDPTYDIEKYQNIEYLTVSFLKIVHAKIRSTIFNSGAFGTYRKEILADAYEYHDTRYHGDDLQICMHIHGLKGKKYKHSDKIHKYNYKVLVANDMAVTTIVPSCLVHYHKLPKICCPCKSTPCDCNNPDLFTQRTQGWFVSKHNFIPKYFKLVFSCKGRKGIWIRLVALYDLLLILNEYFAIFYMALLFKLSEGWIIEGFVVSYAFVVLSMFIFNLVVLKKNKLDVSIELMVTQPLIYKIIMITIYRYCGLFYNLFIYTPFSKKGKTIEERNKDRTFRTSVNAMYNVVDV